MLNPGGFFSSISPNVADNENLREPQKMGFEALESHYSGETPERESGIVLPVGCGKSGLITLSPFAVLSKRTLVVTPYVTLANQLFEDFKYSNPDKCFYILRSVLPGPDYPEPGEIRGRDTNIEDLVDSDVVVTNIGQLQGEDNRWLSQVGGDFFDLIVFDEGHHSVASTFEFLKNQFTNAKIINYSATPRRADGQIMPGQIVYSYPVRDAISAGYVKNLKALVLNPSTLKYVRHQGAVEIEVTLEEIRDLGERDAAFRRSIVTSDETRDTIVDASIAALRNLRAETDESKLKIIAAALNYNHCIDVVEAYRSKGMRADFVHSLEGAANEEVLRKLENHELDVIVQVRKLGEGFDHKYLSVAAVFSVFRSLSPFVQFVGRVMRAIVQNDPLSPLNKGIVIYHAGSNVAARWTDFRDFSEADQEYYDQLLPEEGWEFDGNSIEDIRPEIPGRTPHRREVIIQDQGVVAVAEVPLILENDDARRAIETLSEMGYTGEQVQLGMNQIRGTRQEARRASRSALDDRISNAAGEILNRRGVNQRGRTLDPSRAKDNWVFLKSMIDRRAAQLVNHGVGERDTFSREDYATIRASFDSLIAEIEREIFDA